MTPLCSSEVFLPNLKAAHTSTHQNLQKNPSQHVRSTISRWSTANPWLPLTKKSSPTCQEGVGVWTSASITLPQTYCGAQGCQCRRRCERAQSWWCKWMRQSICWIESWKFYIKKLSVLLLQPDSGLLCRSYSSEVKWQCYFCFRLTKILARCWWDFWAWMHAKKYIGIVAIKCSILARQEVYKIKKNRFIKEKPCKKFVSWKKEPSPIRLPLTIWGGQKGNNQ